MNASGKTQRITPATPLVDCHTHLDQFDDKELGDVLSRAQTAGVALIVVAGTTLASSQKALDMSETHPILYAGVGLHPADLDGPVDDATFSALDAMARHPTVAVWSETGLDYLPSSPDHRMQQDAFRSQIRLALQHSLPLVVHARESTDDTLRLLREEHAEEVGGAWHYFQGTLEQAVAALDIGLNISLAKPLLRLPELQAVAAQLPLERIVLETDSFPQPFKKYRERWTEPWHLPQVAAKLAELQGTTVEHIAQATTSNALRMLKGRISLEGLTLPTGT
jgi:TatD DNase family protein